MLHDTASTSTYFTMNTDTRMQQSEHSLREVMTQCQKISSNRTYENHKKYNTVHAIIPYHYVPLQYD